MKTKLLAAIGLVLTLGLVGCGKDPDPVTPPDPDTPAAETFKTATINKLAGKKFVLTCAGYEGMSNAQEWLTGFGFTPKASVAEATGEKDFACDKLLDLTTIPTDYIVIVGVGYTGKGLAGITSIEQEIQRAKEIANLKKQGKIAGLVLVEVAGASNRGENADRLLNEVAPYADAIVAKTSANSDNYFTALTTTYGVDVVVASTSKALKDAFKSLVVKG